MMLIDTHTHLFLEEFDADRRQVVARAQEAGVARLFMPNIDVSTLEPLWRMCREYEGYCYPMVGLHPSEVKAGEYKDALAVMRRELEARRGYVAVGEIGIDLYWDRTYRDEQLAAFRQQVEWALEFGLPIVIHCRDAFAEVMQVLRDYASHPGLRGVFHCFTGTEAEAAAVLELPGFCFGINGVVTFKKSALAAVLRQAIPLERVVLETDSPYLAPVPCRGKRNESANIVYTARAVAEAYGKTVEEVAAGTTRTALRLFGQPEEP